VINTQPEPDPYRVWARMRDEGAVQWSSERKAWLVLSHAAAAAAYRDAAFSTDVYGRYRPSPVPMPSSFERDPELNARLRALVRETMPSVEWMRQAIVRASRPIIDAAISRGRQDFVSDLAEPLAAAWLGALFGFPKPRQNQLVKLILIADADPDPVRRLAASEVLRDELLAEIRRRRVAPGADILTSMSVAWQQANADDIDLAAFVAPAVFSVAESRGAQLLTTTMLALIDAPEAYKAVATGGFETALDSAREAARWEPINPVSPRRVIREVEFAGSKCRLDDTVLIILPAVCRDPAQHPEPDRFLLGRAETSLAFGFGQHHCLGRTFALTTTAAVVDEMLSQRCLSIDRDDRPPRFHVDIGRSCRSLPVTLSE
jgi:cytochrome P450